MPEAPDSLPAHPAMSPKIARVPRGGRRSRAGGTSSPPGRYRDTQHIVDICVLHADEQVILVIFRVVPRRELVRDVSIAGNAVLGELAPHR